MNAREPAPKEKMMGLATGVMDTLDAATLTGTRPSRYGHLKASFRSPQQHRQRLVHANVVVAVSKITRRKRLTRQSTRMATMEESSPVTRDDQQLDGSGRTIVVAVDDTEDSRLAVLWTAKNFYRKGDILHLLHVVPFVQGHAVPGAVYYAPPPSGEVQQRMTQQAERFIDQRFLPIVNELGIDCEVDVVEEESTETIADAVCHAAVELGAEAIVVASHKKSGLAKLLTGSSSREVAGKAAVPVLVFHG